MGRPALPIESHLTAVSEFNPDDPGGPLDVSPPADQSFDLPAVVETVFDPDEDLLICESASPADAPQSDSAWLNVPPGAALPAAIACATAPLRQEQEFNIVVVLQPSACERVLTDELLRIPRFDNRALILMPVPSGWLERIAELKAAGWQVADLRGRSTARAIAKALVEARYNAAAKVVLVDASAAAAASQASQHLADGENEDLAQDFGAPTTLAGAFQRLLVANARLVPVVVVDDPVWQSPSGPHRLLSSTSMETRLLQGLWQAVALCRIGYHPFIIANQFDLSRHSEWLTEMLPELRSRATFVVHVDGPHDAQRLVWPTGVKQRRLPDRLTAVEAEQVLSDCCSAAGLVVLSVPRREIVGPDSRRRIGAVAQHVDVPDRDLDTPWEPSPTTSQAQQVLPLANTPEPGRPVTGDIEESARYIQNYRFNPLQQKWIERYCAVGKRNVYLWRWTGCAVEWLTLSCVAPRWRLSVCDTKFLAAMLNVLLDDVVDEQRDPSALTDILTLMTDNTAAATNRLGPYGELIFDVWTEINSRIRRYPREAEFRRLLSYDFRQLCNQVDYSGLLLRHPQLINQTEHDLYSPHGMMVACTATIDLTCSPDFQTSDLGTLREAVWHANSMARIGNLVTTWQREIGHNDFSSGVFARAVSLGWLKPDELSSSNHAEIESAILRSGIEQEFAGRWGHHRNQLRKLVHKVSSVSILKLIEGLERLLDSEYASRGLK